MSDSKLLNLSTAALHRAALSTLSLPPQPPPISPATPPPASLPQSKLIPNTRFVVDGFKHADPNFSASYFLTHFHSDHYTGLSPQWSGGIIYCSSTTGNLLHQILEIPQPLIFPLPISQPVLIDGSEVRLLDANHCPGAVQFLFKVPVDDDRFEKYVHSGDFRYCDGMKNEIAISEFIGADALFLDTTYCNPNFVFPSQDESIDYIVGVIEKVGVQNVKSVLFLVATYAIGMERILMEIWGRCKRKIHVSGKKMCVLGALGLGETGMFTEDEMESDVHVVDWNVLGETWPYFRPDFSKMKEIMSERGYSRVVGFVPTGRTFEVERNKFVVSTEDSFEIHLVPYSEHSSYEELREYVRFLKPKRVVPAVGADVENIDSKHANATQTHFARLLEETAVKQEFLMGFLSGGPEAAAVEEETASPESKDLKQENLEKYLQELRDCLPSWATLCQMKELLESSGGNVVEAVSNFYEHETEFHEQVGPTASISCVIQETPEDQLPLDFENHSVKSTSGSEIVPLSQSFKLSSPVNVKKSGKSPGKRKGSFGGKTTKKSRAVSTRNSTDSKQYSITKFFNKRMPVVSEDSKAEVKLKDSCCDQSRSPTEAI